MSISDRNGGSVRSSGRRVEGRTRRVRAIVAAGLGLVSLSIMYQMVGNGAMGVNFTTTDTRFKVYTNYLEGIVGAGYLAPSTKVGNSQQGVAELAVKEAHLAGLCLILQNPIPGLSTVASIVVTAGVPVKGSFGDNATFDGKDASGATIARTATGALTGSSLTGAVQVHDLFLNAAALTGYGSGISGLALGRSADQVSQIGTADWPAGSQPPQPGAFGLTAEQLNIGDMDGDSFGMRMNGEAELPGLKIRIYPTGATQADCATQAGS